MYLDVALITYEQYQAMFNRLRQKYLLARHVNVSDSVITCLTGGLENMENENRRGRCNDRLESHYDNGFTVWC